MNETLIIVFIAIFIVGLIVGYIPSLAVPIPNGGGSSGAPNPGHSWSEIGNFPSACPTGKFVTGIGSSLTCNSPTANQIGGNTDAERTFNSTGKYTFLGALDVRGVLTTNGGIGIGTTDLGTNKLKVAGNTEIIGNLTVSERIGIGGSPNPYYPLYATGRGAVGFFENTRDDTRAYLAWDVFSFVGIGHVDVARGNLRIYRGNLSIWRGGVCVDSDGDCTAPQAGYIIAVGYQTGRSDIAEAIHVRDKVEIGDVVIIDSEKNNQFTLTNKSYDTRVAGVISAAPGMILGLEELTKDKVFLAVAGIVPTKVTTINGPIRRGDLLTTSNISGYAMKATKYVPGAIIGKAMESLESGEGKINVLINLF
ncbi:MAG: hypothetical protein QXS48_00390 [Candidatus Aenigmatarchaeota archaeon]